MHVSSFSSVTSADQMFVANETSHEDVVKQIITSQADIKGLIDAFASYIEQELI